MLPVFFLLKGQRSCMPSWPMHAHVCCGSSEVVACQEDRSPQVHLANASAPRIVQWAKTRRAQPLASRCEVSPPTKSGEVQSLLKMAGLGCRLDPDVRSH